MAVWSDNLDLMLRLQHAQNHPAHIATDIMTFAAFADSREELTAYVERHEAAVIRSERDGGSCRPLLFEEPR